MGKIKKGLIIFGIIFVIWVIVMNVDKIEKFSSEPAKTPTQPPPEIWKEKFTPEELDDISSEIKQQRELEIKQQRELEKEIIAWKEKMDETFVADVDPKMSEEEWYYTKNCTEMSMAWGLMPDVLWIESEVKQAIKACMAESGF